MGRLCGGAHEISGIKVLIFLRGWTGVVGQVVGWGGVVGWVVVGRAGSGRVGGGGLGWVGW